MADPIAWGLTYKQGKKLSDLMDGFIDDATEVVEKLGMGLPPRDLVAFTAQSTEDGIQLSFTPPGATYLPEHTASDGKQFACMPAGVLIRYSDTSYPRTPEDGILGYNYKPTGDWVTAAQTCDIVGLTKDTKYYFTAFPYSTEHVYNKNQVAANRAEMTWVGNKGTISVNVQLPAGYTGTLGEYTITLVDQAAEGGENITRTATGVGVTRIGGLVAGKTYKVQLSSTDDLQAPPLSDAITIVGGVNNDVTMTYALLYGTIKVNVTTEPTGMPIGAYTVTLTPNDGSGALTQQGNNSQSVVFSDVKNGVVYTVGLSAINHYTANTNGTVTAVGGQEILHNAQYAFLATLDQCSWAEISAISSAGKASHCFNIGDTKHISYEDDSGTNSLWMEIIGFDHDDLVSGGKAGITFWATRLLYEKKIMNSTADISRFYSSSLFKWLNGEFLTKINGDVVSVIKDIKKETGNSYTPAHKIFVLSVPELFGPQDTSGNAWFFGKQYQGITSDNDRNKSLDPYWTSSFSRIGSGEIYVNLCSAGVYWSTVSAPDSKRGVCIAFCV